MPVILMIVGLILLLRELIPWARAQSSGVIYRRGHSRQAIRRSEEPDRFRSLLSSRLKASLLGFGLIIGGAIWMAANLLAVGMQETMTAAGAG